jgi:DNA-binding CsgD family transcriptional regulator
MPFDAIILFLFSILACTALVGAALYLKSRYATGYLDLYFYFLVVVAAYGLLNWTGPFLVLAVFGDASTQDPMWTIVTLVLLAVPFLLLKMGLFLALVLALRHNQLPGWLLQCVIIGSALALVATLIAVKSFFDTNDMAILQIFLLGFGLISILVQLGILGQFLLASWDGSSAIPGSARAWALGYLIGYVIYVAAAYSGALGAPGFVVGSAPYLYFLLHALPLALIARHLNRAGQPRLGLNTGRDDLAERFGLTPRELEILTQITRGHSNAEIGEALFISPNTVKNHVYNIYQKTGIKNRIQLAAILTSTL